MDERESESEEFWASVHLRRALMDYGQEGSASAPELGRPSEIPLPAQSVHPPAESADASLADLPPWERASIANSVGTPAPDLEVLAGDDDLVVRAATAANPSLPEHLRGPLILEVMSGYSSELDEDGEALDYLKEAVMLVNDKSLLRSISVAVSVFDEEDCPDWWVAPNIRMVIASHASCPDDLWLQYVADNDHLDWGEGEHVWHGILLGRKSPPVGAEPHLRRRLEEAIQSDDYGLQRLVAKYPYAPLDILLKLVSMGGFEEELAGNPATPEIFQVPLDELIASSVALRRIAARGLDASSTGAFRRLAVDDDPGVRSGIAGNDSAPRQLLEQLALDSDLSVRRAAWENPSSSEIARNSAASLGI